MTENVNKQNKINFNENGQNCFHTNLKYKLQQILPSNTFNCRMYYLFREINICIGFAFYSEIKSLELKL